ncbi:MAG TPA: SusC/RagA family TonB-linked outer membrane protein [Gemmatimonadales bacterium]|nr:SusC/RagA family TonB-linked outer membrane protein [Gemmatimonadales bacterium]
MPSIASIPFLLALAATPALAQQQEEGEIAGTVVAQASQSPLAGVQVMVADQPGRIATSDVSGRFRITGVTGAEVTVSARLIGYRQATRTVAVGATDVRFALADRPVELDQVVVTGVAGAAQQRTLGNSIARINASDVVATARVSTVQDLINGRAPGVVVMPGTGMVGSGSKIRVRGVSSFSLSGDPLIYVDGVRVNNETGTGMQIQAFSSGVVSRLNDFDPEEIEDIEILKGPAAATLYGTEAARGVINIITKKGASDGTRYSFTIKQGGNWFMDPEHRVPTNYWRDTTGTIQSVNVIQTEDARGTPVFRTGQVNDYAGSVSGGAGIVRYFASGGWTRDQGAEPNNARRQMSARTNLQITPSSKVDLQTSVGYVASHTTLSCEAGCGGATWGSWFSNPRNLPQFCGEVPGADPTTCGWARGFQSSPPEADRSMQDWQDINRFTGSATLNYHPLPWMTHRFVVGTDFTQEKNEELLPFLTNDTLRFFWGQFADGWKYQARRDIVYNSYDYLGTVKLDVSPKVNSATSFGVQYYTKYFSWIRAEGDFFPAPGLETISAAATKPVTSDSNLTNKTLGFYAQEQIGLQNRLFLTAALRVDNNSSFGTDIKWVTYPKASLSWVLNEEPFFRQHAPSMISTFKLRAAYGESGLQPDYGTALRTYNPVPGPNGTPALTPGFIGNPSLAPERGKETELGFDAGLWNDRVGLDFTFYNTRTLDAILRRDVAPSSGFGGTAQFVNAGEIRNRGIEALLKAQIASGPRYGWDVRLNLSHNSGKVVKLSGTDTTIVLGDIQQRVGYAPWSWFRQRVVSADFDPVTGKAINVMCDDSHGGATPCFDANGLVVAPRVFLGRAVPSLEGSFASNVRFLDRFRLTMMIDFKSGYKKLDNNLRARCQVFRTCLENIEPEKYDPKIIAQMQSNGTLRDFVINDAKFAKLREISLSYDAPLSYASRIGARSVSFSVAARNLHTWTGYSGVDPEDMFLSGTPNFLEQSNLPQLASFVFTTNVSF